ncbi:MAG: hypothetical protein AB7V18_02775 [Pyrinomonadaceae bacterium]
MRKKHLSPVFGLILALMLMSSGALAQTDAQFLSSFAADVDRSLPRRLGDAEIRSTQTFCSSGCQAYFATGVLRLIGTTPSFAKQNLNIAQLGQVIKNELLRDYCPTPARQRNISIQVYLKDMYGTDLGNVAYVQPTDCPTGTGTGSASATGTVKSANAQFMASYAAQTRRDIPLTVQGITFWKASTFCASGCENNYAGDFLVVYAKHLSLAKQNIPLAQLSQSFLPAFTDNYCNKSGGAAQRNVTFQVQLTDMYNNVVGDLARLTPASCQANANISVPITTGGTQFASPDSQFLANWADEVRRDLPFVFGSIQFTAATTYCSVGCQSTTPSAAMLVLSSRAPNLSRNNIDLNQLGPSVRSFLIDKYCTRARNTNYMLLVDLVDRNSNYVGRPVSLSPGDCPAVATPIVGQTTAPSTAGSSVEQQLWDAVKNSARVQDFQTYLNDFPNGQYSSIARLRISQLGGGAQSSMFSTSPNTSAASGNSVEEQYWDTVKNSTRVQDLQSYLNDYPNGQFAPIARLRISQLGGGAVGSPGANAEDQYWNAIANSQNLQDFQGYLNNYPSGKYAAIARVRISQIGGAMTPAPPSTGSGLFSQQTTGDQILKMAQFGSLGEMANLKTFWVLTDANDLKSRQAISEELTKAFPKLSTATSFEDADFYLVFGMTDSSGVLVTDNSNRSNQTLTGQLMVFTSGASSGGQPSIRILFRSTKSQSFTQAGISLFQTSPAKSTTKDFIKALEKMKF